MSDETDSWERDTIKSMLEMTIKEQRSKRRWGIFFKLLFAGYVFGVTAMLVMQKEIVTPLYKTPFTAMISIEGPLASDKQASAKNIIPALRVAFKEKQAKAIMLRINSPGGSPVQSQQIYTEIKRLKAKFPDKKIYAVIEEVGASGAYWLACSADEIYADQTSIVGSIGVVLSSFGFVDAMQKLGVERRLYTAGSNKGMLDPFSPRNPAQDAMLQNDLSEVHQLFIDLVKQSRGARLKESSDMFSGRFWLGIDAKNLGLIDGFGDPNTVARDIIEAPELVEFAPSGSIFSKVTDKFAGSIRGMLAEYALG